MSTSFIGQIQPYSFDFAPYNWARCDGDLLPIAQFTAVFSLLGTIYGGDGKTTFALPDLRGRAPTFFGTGPGLNPQIIGEKGGAENCTLTLAEIPSHHHSARAVQALGASATPGGSYYAADSSGEDRIYNPGPPNSNMSYGMVSNSGGSRSHNNMQPYLAINFCICLYGIYPSRS